jgi:hypothetical protein
MLDRLEVRLQTRGRNRRVRNVRARWVDYLSANAARCDALSRCPIAAHHQQHQWQQRDDKPNSYLGELQSFHLFLP